MPNSEYVVDSNNTSVTLQSLLPDTGDANDNSIFGTSGSDLIEGLAGDDLLFGGAGSDTLDGGTGTDTASYGTAGSGVLARLDGGANSGAAAGHQITDVENLVGSYYNDTLVGSSGANVLGDAAGNDIVYAADGNDTLVDGAGADALWGQNDNDLFIMGTDSDADTIKGGAGTDTIDYSLGTEGIELDLNGTGAGGASGDTLNSVENAIASDYDDKITGHVDANHIQGLGGDDTIEGGNGADTIDGGNGSDTATYATAISGGVCGSIPVKPGRARMAMC